MKGIKLIVDDHKQNYKNLLKIIKYISELAKRFEYLNKYCDLLNDYQNKILSDYLPKLLKETDNNKSAIVSLLLDHDRLEERVYKLEHTIKYLYIVIGLLFVTVIIVLVILIALL